MWTETELSTDRDEPDDSIGASPDRGRMMTTEHDNTEITWLAALADATAPEAELAEPLATAAAATAWSWATVGAIRSADDAGDPVARALYWMDLAEAVDALRIDLELVGAVPAAEPDLPEPQLHDTPELRAGVFRALTAARNALVLHAETLDAGAAQLQTRLAVHAVERAIAQAASG